MDTQFDGQRLHRSRRDRIVFGVCGGLGEYFAIDPVLIRLAFVLVTLAGGAGVLAYIILAIVLPEEGDAPLPGHAGLRRNVAALRANTAELTGGRGTAPAEPFTGHGAAPAGSAAPRRSGELGAFFLIGIGLILLLGNLGWMGWFHWHYVWPTILIAVGVSLLFRRGGTTA